MALVTQFLTNIRNFVRAQDAGQLSDWLRVEPPLPSQYFELGNELRSGFRGDGKLLQSMIEKCLPEDDDVPEGQGTAWPGFISFMVEYLEYWRDVNFEDLVMTHEMLSSLL